MVVCFLEATDWPGGQMSASGVTAIDFGQFNRLQDNWPQSFRQVMTSLRNQSSSCWVSTICYLPKDMMDNAIFPLLENVTSTTGLRVFLRSVVVNATRDAATGAVVSVRAVTRSPTSISDEWDVPLSKDLADWYSAAASPRFGKTVTDFKASVFVEASEFGDLLVSGGLAFAQGVETPLESSRACADCGQSATVTYFMQYDKSPPVDPKPVPAGSAEGESFGWEGGADSPEMVWSYRRAHCDGNTSVHALNRGDVTQQNWGGGNDLDTASLFLSREEAITSARSGMWQGGINLTALDMAEQRAYGSYHWFVQAAASAGYDPASMGMAWDVVGTGTGLSRMPYLRDTRRAIGLDGFRLDYAALSQVNASHHGTGYKFSDTVALGNYNDDVHPLHTCTMPSYMQAHATVPFYIPFRALTVQNAPNVLVCGKTMSQTFHANGATRLHPSEWTTGVAAGAAAGYMADHGLSSRQLLTDDIASLQTLLNSSKVGQPLEWSGL